MAGKKMGRPTSDPKPHSLHVRVNSEELRLLDEHCRSSGKTRAEVLRECLGVLREKSS